MLLDSGGLEEEFEAAAAGLTCVPPTTVTQGHEAGQLGVEFVPLRFNEPIKKFVKLYGTKLKLYAQETSQKTHTVII